MCPEFMCQSNRGKLKQESQAGSQQMGEGAHPRTSAHPCYLLGLNCLQFLFLASRVPKKQVNENHILPRFLESFLSGDTLHATALLQSSSDICGYPRPCPK